MIKIIVYLLFSSLFYLAPSFISEIEVDDQAYPVEVLEIQENVFDMKAPLQWPKVRLIS